VPESFLEILKGEGVEGALAERLTVYLELLERWSRTHNLVRFADRRELVTRHVLESLAGLERLGERGGLLVDVGSGAGFPGVPLLVGAPAWRGVLIEPRTKRWAFLRTVIRELDLAAEAWDRRYEDTDLGPGSIGALVSRAVGRHDALLAWGRSRLAPKGEVLLWLGPEDAKRLQGLTEWHVVTSPLPGLDRGLLAVCRPCFT